MLRQMEVFTPLKMRNLYDCPAVIRVLRPKPEGFLAAKRPPISGIASWRVSTRRGHTLTFDRDACILLVHLYVTEVAHFGKSRTECLRLPGTLL